MAHYNTVLNQMVNILSRHEFESLAKVHHTGQRFRSFNRWSQFLAMLIGQLSARRSLRDLVDNISAQKQKLYHLGMRPTNRATLARVNEQQPASPCETVFHRLLHRCQHYAPRHTFKFKGKLYLLDATTVDLCLSLFPWATFRKTKGAIKLHVGLDAAGYLPSFISLTEGKRHEVQWAKALQLPPGSFVVFDRGFTDYTWYESLITQKLFFALPE